MYIRLFQDIDVLVSLHNVDSFIYKFTKASISRPTLHDMNVYLTLKLEVKQGFDTSAVRHLNIILKL